MNGWMVENSIVAGDTIRFTESVFGGSYRRSKFVGKRTVIAKVLRESYGADKQQHTFTLEIVSSEGAEPLIAGAVTRRKGRNIYRNGVARLPWSDEAARCTVVDEKHARGGQARALRETRKNAVDHTVDMQNGYTAHDQLAAREG